MSVPSLATAPPRPDLTWLRHRRRPVVPAAPPPAAAQAPGPSHVDYEHHGAPASSSLDLSTPAAAPVPPVSSSLDLSSPAPAPAAPTPAAPVSSSLDLSSAPAAPAETAGPRVPTPAKREVNARRVETGRPLVLTRTDPVVTLNRLQSGIGTLALEAACSDAVGDLRLACAFRLSNGVSSVATNRDGLALAPVHSQTPVLRVHRDRFDTVTIDCRRIQDLDRLLLIGYSPSGAELNWGGTLILGTFGEARVEVPMDGPQAAGAVGLVTLYQVDGELVVRAEPRLVVPSIREACLEFGFDRITWLDPSTPAL